MINTLCLRSASSRLQLAKSPQLQKAGRIAAILNSFSDDSIDGTEQLLVDGASSSTKVTEEELQQWQTPHLPILTNRQLELSLLEIERRKKLKLQSKQRGNHSKAAKTSSYKTSEAAILVPLCTVQGTPSILFTRRSATLSNHASQISFPGGYYDEELDGVNESDNKLINTALRETQEELCYDVNQLPTPSFITVLGRTQPVPSMQGKKVTPIIGMCNYDLPHHSTDEFEMIFPGNPDEVDWIFTIPIKELIKGETSEPLERWSTSYSGEKGTSRKEKKSVVLGPAYHIPECDKKREGDKIWGLTAIVLRPLLRNVLGPVFCGEDIAKSKL